LKIVGTSASTANQHMPHFADDVARFRAHELRRGRVSNKKLFPMNCAFLFSNMSEHSRVEKHSQPRNPSARFCVEDLPIFPKKHICVTFELYIECQRSHLRTTLWGEMTGHVCVQKRLNPIARNGPLHLLTRHENKLNRWTINVFAVHIPRSLGACGAFFGPFISRPHQGYQFWPRVRYSARIQPLSIG